MADPIYNAIDAEGIDALSAKLADLCKEAPESAGDVMTAIYAMLNTACPLAVSVVPTAEARRLVLDFVEWWFNTYAGEADSHFFGVQDPPVGSKM